MTRKYLVLSQTKNDIDRLQIDLINLGKWWHKWIMLFNIDKCKIMHLGLNNVKSKYETNGKYLKEVIEDRDLGVIKDKEINLQLYKSLVRPYLLYSIQAWRPHYQKI